MTPERWLRLEVDLSGLSMSPEQQYALTECLIAAGSSGTQEVPGGCVTYFQPPSDIIEFKATVESNLSRAVGADPTCTWGWQAHEEWADLWRQGFQAHEFGSRLRVSPPWIEAGPADTREVVVIDPGLAFGTAEHGSTRSCLTLIERHLRGGESVLDVGAGSGVLAIAALKLGAVSAMCVEVDEMACHAMGENAERNGVDAQLQTLAAPFEATVAPGHYDLVVCNMVRSRLLPFLEVLADRVDSRGSLLLGGIQSDEREQILRDLGVIGSQGSVSEASGTQGDAPNDNTTLWSPPEFVEDEGWLALRTTRLT